VAADPVGAGRRRDRGDHDHGSRIIPAPTGSTAGARGPAYEREVAPITQPMFGRHLGAWFYCRRIIVLVPDDDISWLHSPCCATAHLCETADNATYDLGKTILACMRPSACLTRLRTWTH
jgi:hypothetical protein